MKFKQIENLPLNKAIEKYIKANKDFETPEDFIASLVRERLKDQLEQDQQEKIAKKKEDLY
ncbi:MAG: hypothetical protein V1743_05265 [Nanoarchaeota archaeon]